MFGNCLQSSASCSSCCGILKWLCGAVFHLPCGQPKLPQNYRWAQSPSPSLSLSLFNEDISACVHSAQVIFANFVRFVCRRHTKKQFAVHFNWSLVRGNLLSSTDTDIDTARERVRERRERGRYAWLAASKGRQAGRQMPALLKVVESLSHLPAKHFQYAKVVNMTQ